MSKEQLKKAKVLADMIRKETRLPHNFPYELIDWLIEQAEQNERYREALEKIKKKISKQLERLDTEKKLQKQNKRYREALEFIGNHVNESELMNNTMNRELVKEVIEKALKESE